MGSLSQLDSESEGGKMVVKEETSRPTLTLTEEEALALLIMCMLSPAKLDGVAEEALRKLAGFCRATQYYVAESSSDGPQS